MVMKKYYRTRLKYNLEEMKWVLKSALSKEMKRAVYKFWADDCLIVKRKLKLL